MFECALATMASLFALLGLGNARLDAPENTAEPSVTPSLLVVFGTVGLIATVTYTHAYIPLISSLYNLQLPLCLYLFVVVKTVVHLVGSSPEQTRAPSLPEVYTCVQVMVSEMYVVFLMMLAAKLTLQGGHA